ncbi:centrosomal protein of 295 kDa [Heteronotia binoei]|uniref:centrosomal protein of 295 kDa n=1 Tax=Heteronotia binoei TaxID=13085 RepID=UPI00292FFBE5|nr:centrosomal protein of 295 kDa [Heteronotia binoei]
MKRKVAKVGRLRLSPNEEALLLKEEYERRRKLRLQQVREQERNIALQIRQDVKQRRDEQLQQLAEELKAEWRKAQEEKIKTLEKLYLASLRAIGEGHRQAKENKPDLEAAEKQRERKQRAERRHKEALKEQKNQKQKLQKEQTWRANARKHALRVEKERAAKIASLPPPPPHPFENIELKSMPTVKVYGGDSFAVSRHHFFDPYVDREMDTEQPDARLLAEEEAKRQEGLQSEEEREKREQLEKAHLRGKQALKMVRLARDREKLMNELERMQNMDLARRRQIVAQMPPQLFEPGYRREELREEWQRELECAFEDMYTGERKMRGDLILHLDPQPLPTLSDPSQDDELDLSQEPGDAPLKQGDEQDTEPGAEVEKAPKTHPQLALKKLLSKIRNQKDNWTARHETAAPSETDTIESGTISSRERRVCESELEDEPNRDPSSEAAVVPEILDQTVVAGNVGVRHSQEQPTNTGKEVERQKQMEWLEYQKQEQLALLQHIEEQRIQLEVDLLRAQMQDLEGDVKKEQEKRAAPSQAIQTNDQDPVMNQQQKTELKFETVAGTQVASSSREDDHIQMIRDYQQRLLVQNRMHKESIDEAWKRLQEYQNKLKQRYASVSAALFGPAAGGFKRLSSVPAPSSLSQGPDASQRAGHLLSTNASVEDFARAVGYSELPRRLEEPSKNKDAEQRLDVGSRDCIQTMDAQVQPSPFESSQISGSHKETEKANLVETPATQGLEFHGIPGLVILKTQDISAKMQPILPLQQVQPALPTDTSPGSSETFHPYKSETCGAPAEETQSPASLKHMLAANRAAFDQPHRPPVQPLPPPTASEPGRPQELGTKSGSLSSYSDIVELRDRMLASSKSIEAQQEHLKELQEQLDEQREALLARQRVQEDLLMRKHAQLKKQMEQQQEALKVFLQQAGQSSTYGEATPQAPEPRSFRLLATLAKEANFDDQEETECGPTSSPTEEEFVFSSTGSSQQIDPFQSTWEREPKWRPSKPPLAKVKLGLDLEQHELSTIQELDTPRSSRLSGTGYRESLPGDTFFTLQAGRLQSRDHPDESLHEEIDLLRITADAKGESSSESLSSHLSQSWHDKWLTDASNLCDPVHPREHSFTDQGFLRYAADIGKRLALYPNSSFRQNNTVALNTARSPGARPSSPQTPAQGAACSYLSSSTISAASIVSNEKLDRSFASTGLSSPRKQLGCLSSPAEEKADTTWSSSAFSLYKQDAATEAPDSHFPFGESLHSDSRIQQIINKYTRSLSQSLSNLSSHDLTVGVDVSNTERNSPAELFQPLQPSPDFDDFLPLSEHGFSHGSKSLSKSSDLSRSHELPVSSSEERSISLSLLAVEKQSNTLQTKEADEETEKQTEELSSIKMDASVFQPDVEGFFESLLVKSSSEPSHSADKSMDFITSSEHATFEQMSRSMENMYISPDREAMEGGEERINPLSPVESFRSAALSPVEDCGSFYQLIPDNGLQKTALGMTLSVKEDVVSREKDLCFAELPMASTDPKHEAVPETVIMNEDRKMNHFQGVSYPVREHSSLQTETLLNSAQEASSEVSVRPVQNSVHQSGCLLDTLQRSSSSATHVKSFDSCLSQSDIPVWERQMGRGIMEEPDLTLISSNDVSIASSDLELLKQRGSGTEETGRLSRRNHSESCPESGEFLPLNAEVNDSISTQRECPGRSPKEDCYQNQKPETMLLEFPSAPGSLQELFLKRKKKFIEGSSKRLEKIKSREQCSAKPPLKAPPQKPTKCHKPKENLPPSGAAASHLKKVVEVKVCSVEDRKTAEMEMHQRTSRLYNNLNEVKIRKEERERREIYAKNREKAKEFQKKTLEILRAKKTR